MIEPRQRTNVATTLEAACARSQQENAAPEEELLFLTPGAHTLFEPGEAGAARANPHSNPKDRLQSSFLSWWDEPSMLHELLAKHPLV